MADKKNLSVAEVLAACRAADGSGGGAAGAAETPPPAETETPSAAPPAEKKPAAAAASAKDPKKMSVAEMLAAARAEKSGGAAADEPSGAAADEPAETAAAPAASAKDPKKMSVQEMLAAARAEKSGAKAKPAGKPAAKPAAAKPAAGKPAAKAAADKTSAKPAAKATGPKDTTSILAAARKAAKPGPITKAEAARAGKEIPKAAAKEKPGVPPMPVKPDYARPRATTPAATADDGSTRRGFFAAFAGAFLGSSLAVGFTSLTVTNLLWLLGLARFMFPNILTEPPTQFKVGFPDEYGPGQVQEKYKAQFGVWVVRYEYEGQLQIYALKTVCTHLGCTPNWLEGEQKFKCPCHGSGFYKDGVNFEGPAPRPLERYAIVLADDGQLEVDKSRKFQEELGQWKDPASFVPV